MNTEQAAAMERVRRVNAGDDVADVYAEMLKCHGYEGLDTVAYSMCDSDRAMLARLFIAERDETTIDEAWLLSIGFKVISDGVLGISRTDEQPVRAIWTVKLWQGRMCEWWYCAVDRLAASHGAVAWPTITTRGQLLRLLSALGIPTTDAEAK